MKKYANINKYFNTNSRFWIIVMGIVLEMMFVILFFAQYKTAPKDVMMSVLIFIIYVICVFSLFYVRQLRIVGTYMGKSLKKRGYNVENILEEINLELETSFYAQVHRGLNKSMDFIITRNWLVGTDDLFAMRANALKLSDICGVELNEIDTYSVAQGTPGVNVTQKKYKRIKIVDKKNNIYFFVVKNEKYQQEAYKYIKEHIIERNNAMGAFETF